MGMRAQREVDLLVCSGADPAATDAFAWTAADAARTRGWEDPRIAPCAASPKPDGSGVPVPPSSHAPPHCGAAAVRGFALRTSDGRKLDVHAPPLFFPKFARRLAGGAAALLL